MKVQVEVCIPVLVVAYTAVQVEAYIQSLAKNPIEV